MRPKLREFLAALNALPATDSFWNAILETVLKLLAEIIITNLGIYRQKKTEVKESMGMGEIYKVQMKKKKFVIQMAQMGHTNRVSSTNCMILYKQQRKEGSNGVSGDTHSRYLGNRTNRSESWSLSQTHVRAALEDREILREGNHCGKAGL